MKQGQALGLEILALSFGALFLNSFTPAAASATPEEVFAKNCQKCHAVSAYGISKKEVAGAAAEEGEEAEDKGAPIPDLSNEGSFHNADFFKEYLQKKVKHEPHAGSDSVKKHRTKFKGSDQELNELANWMATLKKEPTAK